MLRRQRAHRCYYTRPVNRDLGADDTAANNLFLRHAGLLLAFSDLNRQLEINQPRLQKGQRQHVLRVEIMGAVAGMGHHVELTSGPRRESRRGLSSVRAAQPARRRHAFLGAYALL